MTTDDEIRRRIVAARVLLDISQEEMSRRGHELGLDKHELARVERGGEQGLPIKPHYLRVLAEVLDVPLAWFTDPRETIVSGRVPDSLIDLIQSVLDEFRARQVDDLTEPSEAAGDESRRLQFPRGRQPDPTAQPGSRRRAR